jgi:plasmid stabilization system protein ParE
MKLKWSSLAAKRLANFVKYISIDNPDTGRNFANTIFKSIEKLKIFPESGRVVPELDKSKYREILVGNYRLIYSIDNDVIQILTIRHQKQLLKIKDIK